MSRKALFPQSPRHVLLYDEDWEYLETRFGPAGLKPIGVSNVIRTIIHNKVLALREAENIALTELKRNIQNVQNGETLRSGTRKESSTLSYSCADRPEQTATQSQRETPQHERPSDGTATDITGPSGSES